MYKSLFALLFTFTFLACQSDTDQPITEQPPADRQMQERMHPEQPQQQAEALDVSDDELQTFVDASSALQEVQMGTQQEMIEIVEGEGLSVDVYNQIAQARHMGESEEDLNVSSEDMEKFENAFETISEMEVELEAELASVLEEEGMDLDRYQTINMALQQDPALQQRVQEMMQGGIMQEQPEPESSY